MMEPGSDMDDLIGKVLAGEGSAQEQEHVQNWAEQSDENKLYYETLKTIFEKAASTEVQLQFDTDAAWNKVRKKLASPTQVIPLHSIWHQPLRIAAGLLILLGIGYTAYQVLSPPTQTMALVSDSVTVNDTLPDGSTAFLNKKSELTYEFNPREKTRKVVLKGEAYFTVKHEAENPFVIEADNVLVRDIGTEFNLKAYPGKDTIEIIVTQGEVQFYTRNDSGLHVHAGERAIYAKSTKRFYRIEKPDTNVLAYKTKTFSFNNTDLKSVVNLLNEVYNSKIKLANEKLYKCRLTANFKEDNAAIIAEVIAETMGLTLTKKDDAIILDGAGCDQ
ncbi:MAG: FecR domain-containing protein [Cyclobacteriaceae bacterium]|nr:FecR domain-containing protein [Cyclobacteriaceae bacterium]